MVPRLVKFCGNDRVEIVGGAVAGGAEAEGVVSPGILELGESAGGVEAAAGENDLAVEAGLRVAQRVDFDDAAHVASVFGGNSGGVDGEGVDVVGFDFGAEAGRTIVGERDAVDDELSLILGAAGMEDGVAFVKPAGLRVDQVLQGAAGERRGTLGDMLAGRDGWKHRRGRDRAGWFRR